VVAVGEVYVGFVEDGGPLEGGGWIVIKRQRCSCVLFVEERMVGRKGIDRYGNTNSPCCV
jgi:hypothetical protein